MGRRPELSQGPGIRNVVTSDVLEADHIRERLQHLSVAPSDDHNEILLHGSPTRAPRISQQIPDNYNNSLNSMNNLSQEQLAQQQQQTQQQIQQQQPQRSSQQQRQNRRSGSRFPMIVD